MAIIINEHEETIEGEILIISEFDDGEIIMVPKNI